MAQQVSSPRHNFINRQAPSASFTGQKASTSNIASSSSVSGLGSFQGSATQSSRKVPISHKRSPERTTTKKKATAGSSNQPTQVVFEAWVNSLCPPTLQLASQAGKAQHLPVSSRKVKNSTKSSKNQQQSISQRQDTISTNQEMEDVYVDPAGEYKQPGFLKESQSETVMMQALSPSENTVDFYDSVVDQSQAAINNENSNILYTQNTTDYEEIDPTTLDTHQIQDIMEQNQIVNRMDLQRNQAKLEMSDINEQLAKEYEYVEGLRKHLRIAESRQKALQQQVNTNKTNYVAINQRKNAFLSNTQSLVVTSSGITTPNQESISGSSENFWSEQQNARVKSRKFQLEPPVQKIKEEIKTTTNASSQVANKTRKPSHQYSQEVKINFTDNNRHKISTEQPDTDASNASVPIFQNSKASVSKKGSMIQTNQNAFFEEYKQNLRKINAKKASSPMMKSRSTHLQRNNSHGQQQMQNTLASPQVNKVRHPAAYNKNSAESSAFHQEGSAKRVLTKTGIGQGVFKTQSEKNAQTPQQQIHAFQRQDRAAMMQAPMEQSYQSNHTVLSQPQQIREADHEDEQREQRKNYTEQKRQGTSNNHAPYDFDKYEMLSTSNQYKHLLSQKQDTPKGTSSSENDQDDDPSAQEVMIQYVEDEQVNSTQFNKLGGTMVKKPFSNTFNSVERGDHDKMLVISPEPSRKFNQNSVIQQKNNNHHHLRSERKPIGGGLLKSVAQIEPFASVPKQKEGGRTATGSNKLQSPASRNRPGLQPQNLSATMSGPIATTMAPSHNPTNSFLGSFVENQSPPVIKKQHQSFMSLPKRNQNGLMRSQTQAYAVQSSLYSNPPPVIQQQQTQQDVKNFLGSPAVPPLRKASGSFNGGGRPSVNSQRRTPRQRTRINSPTIAQQVAQNTINESSLHQQHVNRITLPVAAQQSTQSQHQQQIQTNRETTPRKSFNAAEVQKTARNVIDQLTSSQNEEKSMKFVLQFLLEEEEWLDQVQDLASQGNFQEMQAQGLLLPKFHAEFSNQTLYASLFQSIQLVKNRPKVFSMQLNIYVVMAVLLTELLVLDQPTMRKFASKLDDVLKNCHQNFLLMIEFMLSSADEQLKKSFDCVLLRKVIEKKLHSKTANRLVTFRQKNDQCRAFLKRIASELHDSQIAKLAPSIQEFCSALLETLRMTIDEAGMDITKNPTNQKHVVQKLDQIYDLGVSATQDMKMASKKAHIKKSKQLNTTNERKVKSVMRGYKANHNSAQKSLNSGHISPNPKRMRAGRASPNAVQQDSRIQGHLFGATKNSGSEKKAAAVQRTTEKGDFEYLHTVEETDSPAKSALQLMSEASATSPDNMLFQNSANIEDASIQPDLQAREEYFLKQNQLQKPHMKDRDRQRTPHTESITPKTTMARKTSQQDKRQSYKRNQTYTTSNSNGDQIKHIKTTIVPGSKKSGSQLGGQRQNSGSPAASRRISPLKQASSSGTKTIRGVVVQQTAAQQLNQYATTNNVLPENLAFVLANSGVPQPDQQPLPQQQASSSQGNFRLAVQATLPEQPVFQKHKSQRDFSKGDRLGKQTQRDNLVVGGATSGKSLRRGTLTKSKASSSQQFAFPSNTERRRMNTVVTSNAVLERRKTQKQLSQQSSQQNLTTIPPTSSENLLGAQRHSNRVGNLLAGRFASQVVLHQHQPKVADESNSAQKMEAVSLDNDEEIDEPSSSNVLMLTKMKLNETHDEVQPFDMSMTTTSVDDHPNNQTSNLIENQEVSLFKSSQAESNNNAGNNQQLLAVPVSEPSQYNRDATVSRQEHEEGISSVYQTTAQDRSQLEADQQGDSDFSLTEDDEDEDDDDDEDEDGSLILGRSPIAMQQQPMMPMPKPHVVGAAVGAAITPRDQQLEQMAVEENKMRRDSSALLIEETKMTPIRGTSSARIAPRASDLNVESPFEQAQIVIDNSNREVCFKQPQIQQPQQRPRFSIPLPLEKLNKHQQQSTQESAGSSGQAVQLPAAAQQKQSPLVGRFDSAVKPQTSSVFHPVIEQSMNEENEMVTQSTIQATDLAHPALRPRMQASQDVVDDIRLKFNANNFFTPRNDFEPKSTGRLDKAVLAPGADATCLSGKTGPTAQHQDMVSLKITEVGKENGPTVEVDAIDEDNTMKQYVDDLLGGGIGGRRSTIRANSLLFEEDSLQIKREMVRQKQAKQRENKEQRISIQFTAGIGGARRTTRRLHNTDDDLVVMAPNSARNTVSHADKVENQQTSIGEFGMASSAARRQNTGYRSQSLIDLDSAEAKSSCINTAMNTERDKAEVQSFSKLSSEARTIKSSAIKLAQLPLESPQPTAQLRIETQQNKESEKMAQYAINSPILQSVKISSPQKEEQQNRHDVIETPPNKQLMQAKFRQIEMDEPGESANGKGVKSAANAELVAFYQSLIPEGSKEKDDDGNAFNLRSKSMVTNFMDIPDSTVARSQEDDIKEETGDLPQNRNSSSYNAYSNQGTFQTPERGHSGPASPNNFVMKDVIMENTAEEDDMSPESAEILPFQKKRNSFTKRKESFQTHAFESIDSFVKLENQLLTRGESLVNETSAAFSQAAHQPFQQQEKEHEQIEYEGITGAGSSSNMIDDEQDEIDVELALLRQNVSIPYLSPIDTTMIDESEVYTLVLDLDETLIHYECDDTDGDYYLIRPGAIQFLREMALYYEIVIFTAAMPEYADKILDNLDENGFMIKYRLYRQHTTPTEDYAIKDLHNLGRKLERTIIVDNLAENFLATTPNNGIWVESWYDDMQDTVLPRLQRFLQELVEEQVPDVRKVLTQEIKDQIIYASLESSQPIPPLSEIIERSANQ